MLSISAVGHCTYYSVGKMEKAKTLFTATIIGKRIKSLYFDLFVKAWYRVKRMSGLTINIKIKNPLAIRMVISINCYLDLVNIKYILN